ncbi:HFL178Cp [Eremothecium sinecaudum]|uniref:HFL178Cp n=1 Tax=Eremothecium sinecaudum TaxID=45286 RepID=A0A120K2I7_9SACH|nr:HFL178Cp [Eremothecium sinecaudum]AMD21678.1 HFL178Cp [Eremothecium sinecaudum]
MKPSITDYLKTEVLILDGGSGSELENRGLTIGKNPFWSTVPFLTKDASQLNIVREMYKDFRDAGARALSTITYQSSYHSHIKYGDGSVTNRQEYSDFLDYIIGFTYEKCIDSDQDYLIGSIGPYASYLSDGSEYTGDYGFATINFASYYEPQATKFASDSRIDLIAFETIPNLEEITAIMQQEFTGMLQGKPFIISISTDREGNMRDGTTPERLCNTIRQHMGTFPPNLLSFGINCVEFQSSDIILQKLNSLLHDCPVKFHAVYPNSGELYDAKTAKWQRNMNITFEPTWEHLVSKFLAQGCKIIGGCCRTTPKDIKQIADAVRK